MLLGLGRMMNPARGAVAGGGALPRLTDLVAGLTANWEPYYASSLAEALTDTTGNGHDQTAAGEPTLALINGTANGISLDGSSQHMTCNSLATLVSGEDQPCAVAYVSELAAIGRTNPQWRVDNTGTTSPFRLLQETSADRIQFHTRDDAEAAQALAETAVNTSDTNPHVYILNFTGTAVSVYQDGTVLSAINSASANVGVLTLNRILFGSNGTNFLSGTLAPCCFKAGTFSGADITAVTDFLKARYGIA